MRMPMKTYLALAILTLIAALLGSPWMNQRFHMPDRHASEKSQALNAKTAGSPREPAVSNSD
ncbi:hypothetical protein SB757_17310 [Pseudomonas sp. SIMBA_065]